MIVTRLIAFAARDVESVYHGHIGVQIEAMRAVVARPSPSRMLGST